MDSPRKILVPLALLSVVALATLLLGCHDPYVQRTMEHDRQTTRFALDSYAEREARCSANLRSTSAMTPEQWRDDVETLPRSLAGAKEFFREDDEDWPRRDAAAREEIRRQLDGDLTTILWTLPRLAF